MRLNQTIDSGGINNMMLIILNGPSSAGKSSIARLLKDKLPAEVVALDDLLPDDLQEPMWEDDIYALMP